MNVASMDDWQDVEEAIYDEGDEAVHAVEELLKKSSPKSKQKLTGWFIPQPISARNSNSAPKRGLVKGNDTRASQVLGEKAQLLNAKHHENLAHKAEECMIHKHHTFSEASQRLYLGPRNMSFLNHARQSRCSLRQSGVEGAPRFSLHRLSKLNESVASVNSNLEMDESSLHVLCQQVAELMGGPVIPIARPSEFQTNPPQRLSALVEFESDEDIQFRLSKVDVDEQREMMARIERDQGKEAQLTPPQEEPAEQVIPPQTSAQSSGKKELIEVGPGQTLPLLGSDDTFQAILEGRWTVTRCMGCEQELTVVDQADLVICSDCMIFSFVEKSDGDASASPQCVGMGIKGEEMMDWISGLPENES